MQLKHTPGPWREDMGFIYAGESSQMVCDVDTVNDDWEANARLIAAAPAMLDALKYARAMLDQSVLEQRERSEDETRAALRIIRGDAVRIRQQLDAAIAQATGAQS